MAEDNEVKNDNDEDITEVEAETVKPSKAVVIIKRHMGMAGVDAPHVEGLTEHITIDAELNLGKQQKMDELEMLEKDIDTLTHSRDWYQVSKETIGELFDMNGLRKQCYIHSAKEIAKYVAPALAGIIVLFMIMTSSLPVLPFLIGAVICIGFEFFLWCACFAPKWPREFQIDMKMTSIKLTMEEIEKTSMKLPISVKLKLKEAKDSQIFYGFSIAYPKITHNNLKMPELQVDPALIGVATDARLFLICHWDLARDEAVIKEGIGHLRDLKVSGQRNKERKK